MKSNNNVTNVDKKSIQDNSKIQWEIKVPIFRNSIIIRQLAIAIGIPFGLLFFILLIATGGEIFKNIYALYAFVFIGILFIVTFILIMIIYDGKYSAGFVIDSKGILNYTQKKQAKTNRIINGLTIMFGLLSGKFTAAGAGILAQSKQSVLIKWNRIRKIKVYPKSKSILIKGGRTENIAVFCTKNNFNVVKDIILNKANIDLN